MKLDKDFKLDKYGLSVRLVNQDDAEFIIGLRTNIKLGRFLNFTNNDIKNQKKWIRDYKIREKNGLDYYFIYTHNGERIGVNRIYNINGKTATAGSWVCSPHLPFEIPFITVIIIREIFFDILQLQIDLFDTRKENKKVIRMHKILGAHKIFENENDVYHYLTVEDFKISKPKILEYINLKEEA
mgnify:CR=1 FL=1|tara:strand:+ start:1736 stop:2287 length:552 start_codon:yes stop_codon:yes gene_type:complete